MKSPNIKMNAVLICVLIISAVAIFPFINVINFCCGGMLLGGFFSVNYYYKHSAKDNKQVNVKDVFMITLLGGILSAIIVSGISLMTMFINSENQITLMKNELGEFIKSLPQEFTKILDELSSEFDKFGFSPTLAVTSLIVNLIMYPAFAFAGGLISYGLNNRKRNQTGNSHI